MAQAGCAMTTTMTELWMDSTLCSYSLSPVALFYVIWWFYLGTQVTSPTEQNEAICSNSSVESHWSETEEIQCGIWSGIVWILPTFQVMWYNMTRKFWCAIVHSKFILASESDTCIQNRQITREITRKDIWHDKMMNSPVLCEGSLGSRNPHHRVAPWL